jgi:hypothetical protein
VSVPGGPVSSWCGTCGPPPAPSPP